MTSISMMVAELNTSLQGKEVFDTAEFPTATFKSTSATRTGPMSGHRDRRWHDVSRHYQAGDVHRHLWR